MRVAALVLVFCILWSGCGVVAAYCLFPENCTRRAGRIKALLAGPVFWVWAVVDLLLR